MIAAPARLLALPFVLALLAVSGCNCGDGRVMQVNQDGAKDSGYTGGSDQPCKTDCDCAADQHCQEGGPEIGKSCAPGAGTCNRTGCDPACPSGQVCVTGHCYPTGTADAGPTVDGGNLGADAGAADAGPWVDGGGLGQDAGPGPDAGPDAGVVCPTGADVTGAWKTDYTLDVSPFVAKQNALGDFVVIMDALVKGQSPNCAALHTSAAQTFCVFISIAASGGGLQGPPWLGDLLDVLVDVLSFGNKPLLAKGVMNVQKGAVCQLDATETWSEMLMMYKGQYIDLMSSPLLGQAGTVTVTVNPFHGRRTATDVYFGPRTVDMDVDHLIIAIIDVAIEAGSNGTLHNIGDLLGYVVCSGITNPADKITCQIAASSFGNSITANSGMGGVEIDPDGQTAPIFDTNADGRADELGDATHPGAIHGDFTDGVISGGFGPQTKWSGVR